MVRQKATEKSHGRNKQVRKSDVLKETMTKRTLILNIRKRDFWEKLIGKFNALEAY